MRFGLKLEIIYKRKEKSERVKILVLMRRIIKDSFCNDIAERCEITIGGSLREGAGAVGD